MLDIVLIALILIFVISTIVVIIQQKKDFFYEKLWVEERKKWDELYKSYIKISDENKKLKKKIEDYENRYHER